MITFLLLLNSLLLIGNEHDFHLSKSEKREAVKRGKDYEIALVLGEQIHILKDYFAEDVDFENNNLFYATPSDYIISLKLKTE